MDKISQYSFDAQYCYCRDCLSLHEQSFENRCFSCKSPRLLPRHKEIFALSIAHVDCDAFYASVEKKENPAYKNKPIIIGHGKRGVVCTACYQARIYGIHAGMPLYQALKLCPDAIVIKPRMERYKDISQRLQRLMLSLTPQVEPLSIDEAFLDLTGTELLHRAPPAVSLARFSKQVEQEIGITVSIGLSYCKFLAKIASTLEKPRGFSVIGKEEAKDFLKDKPINLLWGVGSTLTKKLHRDGIFKIGQIREYSEQKLAKNYGILGKKLYLLAHAIDDRPVVSNIMPKTFSLEQTFDKDFTGNESILPILRKFSEDLSLKLKKEGLTAQNVILKLKTKDFKLKTRTCILDSKTQMANKIFSTVSQLWLKENHQLSYRLIGVGVQHLEKKKDKTSETFLEDEKKQDNAEIAIDALREKFGSNIIQTGYTFIPKN